MTDIDIILIGAGNLRFAMSSHFNSPGNRITLWNRIELNIKELKRRIIIKWDGLIGGI